MVLDVAADIDPHGMAALAQRLLDDIAAVSGKSSPPSAVDIAAHRLLWTRYMTTGAPRFGDAVLWSLRAICRSPLVDHVRGGVYRVGMVARVPVEKDLNENAEFLELLTWVWRVDRCPELRRCAEGIVAWTLGEMRVPGFGFAASANGEAWDGEVFASGNGRMLVAFVEAGSVLERRDCLASARDIFGELVARFADAGDMPGTATVLDARVAMSRAAIRLFEAFGKRHYLDHAETWMAQADAALGDIAEGRIADLPLASGLAPKIGVLARLHALTGTSRYAERAARLVEAFPAFATRSGMPADVAIAEAERSALLVSIEVSGDPRPPETRELMRIALDCGLPDRMVLGPGAGGTPGERPLVRIGVGTNRLAPIDDATQLRKLLAPGGLAAAFLRSDTRGPVDSRSMQGIT